MSLVRLARAMVPLDWRRVWAQARRDRHDSGAGLRFARTRAAGNALDAWPVAAAVSQPILNGAHAEAKRANLSRAGFAIDGLLIRPGETFSFWAAVGPVGLAQGYQPARTIIADKVTADPGGGLCQLSGLIHHLGLLAGMALVERHPHSRDLYDNEADRFCALGLDATVVQGFKDLRLMNVWHAPLALRVACTHDSIDGALLSPAPPPVSDIMIERQDGPAGRHVRVSRLFADGAREALSEHLYAL